MQAGCLRLNNVALSLPTDSSNRLDPTCENSHTGRDFSRSLILHVAALSVAMPLARGTIVAKWNTCYDDLMNNAQAGTAGNRALGGQYAHVLHESIYSRRDDAKGSAWLRGRLTYVLYRRPRDRSKANTRKR